MLWSSFISVEVVKDLSEVLLSLIVHIPLFNVISLYLLSYLYKIFIFQNLNKLYTVIKQYKNLKHFLTGYLNWYIIFIERGERDSNPRSTVKHLQTFQVCWFNHSHISPQVLRRGWDSNPRDSYSPSNRFRDGPVMTTSVPLLIRWYFTYQTILLCEVCR